MEKVLIVCEEFIPKSYLGLIGIMKEYFETVGLSTEVFCVEVDMDVSVCQEKLLDSSLKYICTLDMAGFQAGTVLGGPMYNMLYAKQIHVVINEESFTRYQDEDFALNLFMFIPDSMSNDFAEWQYISNLFFVNSLN